MKGLWDMDKGHKVLCRNAMRQRDKHWLLCVKLRDAGKREMDSACPFCWHCPSEMRQYNTPGYTDCKLLTPSAGTMRYNIVDETLNKPEPVTDAEDMGVGIRIEDESQVFVPPNEPVEDKGEDIELPETDETMPDDTETEKKPANAKERVPGKKIK